MKLDPNRPKPFLKALCLHYGINEGGGYKKSGTTLLRIKTHIPNWRNFIKAAESGTKLILSVYLPDKRDNRKPIKTRLRLSEFVKLYSGVCVPIQIELTPQIELHEAIRQIDYILTNLK